MFSRSLIRFPRNLASRLTIWYAVIFTGSYLAAFLIFSVLVSPIIHRSIDLDLSEEIRDFSSLLSSNGVEELKPYLRMQAQNNGVDKKFYRLLASNGEVIASSNMSSWKGIHLSKAALKRAIGGGKHVFESRALPEKGENVRLAYGKIGAGVVLEVGQSLNEAERLMGISRTIFGLTLFGLMVVAPAIGWFMARRALLGVEEVTRTATEISSGALEKRVPVKRRGDEIERLATAFNRMVDRIQALITGMREVTDNIAHDLRTPLARIRGVAETTLTSGASLSDYQGMAVNTVEESDHLLELLNTMLDISEVESGARQMEQEEIDVSETVRYACDLFQPLGKNRDIRIRSDIQAGCRAQGDLPKIQRMVANLLDNALKYTDPGGSVTVSVRDEGEKISVSLEDTGIGIAEEDLPHIFDRFYRCDRSRSQSGAGLGLSLARAVALAHGGELTAESRLGRGSRFLVALPKAAAAG